MSVAEWLFCLPGFTLNDIMDFFFSVRLFVYVLSSRLFCRMARVCEELRPLVGVAHAGLAQLREERAGGPLRGSEEGPVLQAEGHGPVFGPEGLRGPPALRRGPEGRELQTIGAAEARVRSLHSRNASEH